MKNKKGIKMNRYVMFNLIKDIEKKEYKIHAASFDYVNGENPKIKDKFNMSCSFSDVGKLYYSFEDFCFKNKNPTIVSWGKYHTNNLKEVAEKANADILNLANPKDFINLQDSFRNILKMKRFVKFFYAYEKIAGIGRLKIEKNSDFYEIEHLVYFFGYAIGDKFIKRMDRK